MHIHAMQNNAAFALNSLDAAQRAEAKRRAEETRKKLSESASRLYGESEDCIVTFSERQEGESHQRDRKRQQHGEPETKEDSTTLQISDWA